jgi:hypothetical protein
MYVIFALICVAIFFKLAFTNLVNLVFSSFLMLSTAAAALALKNSIVALVNAITTTGGSTPELRLTQLAISLSYFQTSPLWGHGKNYLWDVAKPANPGLLGAESIWFSLLVDYGLMGCLSFVFLIFACMVVLWKKDPLYATLPLAFFFGKTMSIVMDVDFDMLLVFTVLLLKIHTFHSEGRKINVPLAYT